MTGSGAVRFKVELGSKGRRAAPVRHQHHSAEPEATDSPTEAKNTESELPTRVARMLALGHFIERAIESGDLKDFSEAAKRFGVSRPRLTQVVNLTLLSPKIQEALLMGDTRLSERDLRPLVATVEWERQRERSHKLPASDTDT